MKCDFILLQLAFFLGFPLPVTGNMFGLSVYCKILAMICFYWTVGHSNNVFTKGVSTVTPGLVRNKVKNRSLDLDWPPLTQPLPLSCPPTYDNWVKISVILLFLEKFCDVLQ